VDKYNAFVQPNKRRVICEKDITLDRAIDFLNETKNGVILDANDRYYTKEELEYAKSLRSLPGIGKDSFVGSVKTVHEDTDRKLPDFTRYYTESSSERDSEWTERSEI
jgi:hypothetical protein